MNLEQELSARALKRWFRKCSKRTWGWEGHVSTGGTLFLAKSECIENLDYWRKEFDDAKAELKRRGCYVP